MTAAYIVLAVEIICMFAVLKYLDHKGYIAQWLDQLINNLEAFNNPHKRLDHDDEHDEND